jgi:hypothetical protein
MRFYTKTYKEQKGIHRMMKRAVSSQLYGHHPDYIARENFKGKGQGLTLGFLRPFT